MSHRLRMPGRLVAILFLTSAAPLYAGSYASFTHPTDTISVVGNVPLSNQATYEAVVRLTQTSYTAGLSNIFEGTIWNAFQNSAQDDRFSILNGGALAAVSYPLDFNYPITAGSLETGSWYDLAYVFDGSQERLYIDGNLAVWRPASGKISIGSSNVMALGAVARIGGILSSFQGDIRSLRISNTARYAGNSYTPTFGDFTSNRAAVLLYDFDQIPPGSTTTADLSGHGHTGTAGVGFSGATSPTFGVGVIPGDADLDGKVGFSDLLILAGH